MQIVAAFEETRFNNQKNCYKIFSPLVTVSKDGNKELIRFLEKEESETENTIVHVFYSEAKAKAFYRIHVQGYMK